jgi:hypothetical protein
MAEDRRAWAELCSSALSKPEDAGPTSSTCLCKNAHVLHRRYTRSSAKLWLTAYPPHPPYAVIDLVTVDPDFRASVRARNSSSSEIMFYGTLIQSIWLGAEQAREFVAKGVVSATLGHLHAAGLGAPRRLCVLPARGRVAYTANFNLLPVCPRQVTLCAGGTSKPCGSLYSARCDPTFGPGCGPSQS